MAIHKALPAGCLVYLLADAWGHYKFGRTNNLKARLGTLQTGNAAPLDVAAWNYCSSNAQAVDVERAIKSLVSNHKTGGGDEWFFVEDYEDALKVLERASHGR
jgi:predicted GIY-YIG superfamily endonuclease